MAPPLLTNRITFMVQIQTPWITRRAVLIVLGGLIVTSIVSAIIGCSDQLSMGLERIDLFRLSLAFIFYFLYFLLNALGWTLVLGAFGQELPPGAGIRVWITSEACRWLPGSIWSYGARAAQAAKYGVSPLVTGASLGLELILSLVAWTSVAVVSTLLHRTDLAVLVRNASLTNHRTTIICSLGMLVFALIVCGWLCRCDFPRRPRIVDHLQTLSRLRPDARKVATLLAYYVPMSCLNGLALYQVVLAFHPETEAPVVWVLGANAIAWLIGFFAVFAPGGLVIREGTLATLLAVWLPLELALSIAVAWRMLQMVEELLLVTALSVPLWLKRTPTLQQSRSHDR